MIKNLLPCPFCNEKPRIKHDYNSEDKGFYQARHDCLNLLSEIKTFCYPTKDEVIASWNRRANEWISVEERLPKDGEVVLVHGTCDNEYRKGYDCCWLVNGRWTSWFTKDITHWMPLPEPPEGSV